MLTVRIQVFDGTGTFTLSDSQPCRLLTSLHRRYPASAVLRTSPPPQGARPVPRGHPVGHRWPHLGASRVAYAFLVYMLSPLPRRSGWAYASLYFAQPYQPSPKGSSGRPAHCPFRDAMGRGGEEIASIVADVTDGGPNAKAERPEPIRYRPETGQHTDRSDRNEFAELARCRHRAWRRASAVEEACGRRERIAEAAQSLA